MRAWQPLQAGLARCCSSRWRMVAVVPRAVSSSFGTLGGGGGGAESSKFSQDPFSAEDGRSARRIRGDGEDAGLGENAAAVGIGWEIDAAELRAFDVRDAVESGQALVQEGVVGREEIGDGTVVANDGSKEELGLLLHVAAQVRW